MEQIDADCIRRPEVKRLTAALKQPRSNSLYSLKCINFCSLFIPATGPERRICVVICCETTTFVVGMIMMSLSNK